MACLRTKTSVTDDEPFSLGGTNVARQHLRQRQHRPVFLRGIFVPPSGADRQK